jgi:hypothetical protein
MPSIIAKALELSRQELLDIGLRGNTLFILSLEPLIISVHTAPLIPG